MLILKLNLTISLIFITKFSNNNNISSLIFLSFFYLNKSFYLRISFNLNIIIYEFTRKRL